MVWIRFFDDSFYFIIKQTIMQKVSFLLLACIGFLCTSCNRNYYISDNFDGITTDHRQVAVLPFDMVYTGTIPKNLTLEDMEKIREVESTAFQISLHGQILASTRRGKKPLRITLQPYQKTNAILREKGIDLINVKEQDPVELAQQLGVDAVVVSTVKKNRIMSDLASFGIDAGLEVLRVLTGSYPNPHPGRFATAKEIDASFTLVDKENSTTLWSTMYMINADWQRAAEDIIAQINRRAARCFPYRKHFTSDLLEEE